MLWKIFLIALQLHGCWCEVTYELDVKGEAQHGYYISVDIGQPAQKIKVIIDTGSSEFAVAATSPLKGSNNFYDYTKSKTFQNLDSNVEIEYVQGKWSGFLATDLISVSKNHSMRCTISCMITIHNVFDINSKFAGILGLAYQSLSKYSVLPLFDTMRKSEKIRNVFSVSLCGPYFSNADTSTSCGKLHLGYISQTHYLNDIIYTPIIKEQLYDITLTMIKVGSEPVTGNCKELNSPRSSVDTGTTRLVVSPSVFDKIIFKIKRYVEDNTKNMPEDSGKYWLNETTACFHKKYFNMSFFPNIVLSLYHTDNSSFDLVVSPELYLLPWLQDSSNAKTCFILGIDKSSYGTVIGSTILKGYYVVFHRSKKQIGFANSSFWQSESKIASFVTISQVTQDENYSSCKYIESSDVQNSNINAGTIILLLFILILTVLMLYRIILWVQSIRLQQSDNRSDTSSLVGEDYKL